MTSTRVLIAYNEPVLPADHPDRAAEDDVLYSVKIIRESLDNLAIPHDSFGVTDDLSRTVERLARRDFDVVFNLYEGTADRSITEVYFTGLLEWLKLPYTGCSTITLGLARSKPMAKRLFRAAGVPTPDFCMLDEDAAIPDHGLAFPILVKPASEDASIGIDQGSVVTTPEELEARVRYVLDHYGPPVLIERFVAGRELQVSLIEWDGTGDPIVLPFSEIAYEAGTKSDYWPVYTYAAKWDENSDEYKHAPVKTNVTVPPKLAARIRRAAKQAYRLLEARDYARVDLRIDDDGKPYVLELNPNPSITSIMIDDGLTELGLKYDRFIECIVRNAVNRASGPSGVRRKRE